MSSKCWFKVAVVCGGLLASTSAASAQDWWNPVSWFVPNTYRAAPAYGSCANGRCAPSTYGYGAAHCANGKCNTGTCGPTGCLPPQYGPSYGPRIMPSYRPQVIPTPAPYGAPRTPAPYSTNYRGNHRPSPFYE
jgi:uncharacterized low-complexity protein